MGDLLLAKGIPVNATDKKGRTCLHIYLGHSSWAIPGGNRLFEAAAVHLAFVQKLCASGANATIESIDGNTPLSLAASAELHSVLEVLRQHQLQDNSVPSRL